MVHTWLGWMCDQERGTSMCNRGLWGHHAFCSVVLEAERILEDNVSQMHIAQYPTWAETYL